MSEAGMTIDEMTDDMWREVTQAFERGKDADGVLVNGGFFKEPLLTPTPWYGQAPAPKTAARVISDLRRLREAIEQCSDETLSLFNDAITPSEFDKQLRGEEFRVPPTLLDRLEQAEWLYPSDSARLATGDKALVTSVLGRPLTYRHLEPTFVLISLWKSKGLAVAIGGKRNQSLTHQSERYQFAPMIDLIGGALLKIDHSLLTHEDDTPTTEADHAGRRTSSENARLVAWACATQLRKMTRFENSPNIQKLFEIDA